MLPTLFVVLIFVAAVLLALALGAVIWPDPTRQRLQSLGTGAADEIEDARSPSIWRRAMRRLAEWVAPLNRLQAADEDDQHVVDLRQKLLHAGLRDHDGPQTFRGVKIGLALLLLLVLFLVLLLMGHAVSMHGLILMGWAAALGYVLPDAVLRSMIERRQREVFEHFPELLDLIIVCVEAGLGVEAAMMRVTDEMRARSTVLAEELQLMNLELNAGVDRITAFRNLAQRTGVEDINSFVTILSQSERFGTSIVSALRTQSDWLRMRRRQRIEELANKMPVKLVLPTAFFILPALLIVIVGPALVQMFRQLTTVMGSP